MPDPASHVILVGAPVDCGKYTRGCLMGPDAYRVAGLAEALRAVDMTVEDIGNLAPDGTDPIAHPNKALHKLGETVGWTRSLAAAAREAAPRGIPIFLGGDHAMAAGTVSGMAAHAAAVGRPLFVLWLDAHTDYHTPETTTSGNLHGTPAAYFTGQPGFDAFPAPTGTVAPADVTMIGLRSVDAAERARLGRAGVAVHDMRAIDETGMAAPVRAFLDRAEAAGADVHVSLDTDFLDPAVAPAVGTTVPGGATFREAHLIMEMMHESGRVTSLDLAELDPMLDERGRSAAVMVDLAASLFGKTVLDRPTRGHTI